MAPGFPYLPVELEDNVLVFIKSLEDRKTCRLVSREWNKLMSPILFHDFSTDLQVTSSKTLVTLLNPNNAILPNIRRLGIYPSLEDSTNGDEDFASDNEDSASDDKYFLSGDRETRFQDLVSALPRGSLARFSSHFKIRFHIFQLLMTNQPMIQDLEFDLNIPLPATNKFEDPLAFSSLPHLAGILPYLREIKYVTGHAGYYDSDFVSVFDNLRFVIRNCPKLTGLSISILDRMHNFGDPVNVGELLQAPTDAPMFMNFTKLEFYDISFAQQQPAFLKHINAEKIVTLEINKCYEIAPLLRGIADIFSVGGSALQFLEVIIAHFTTESDEDLYSIETLLESCLGLEGLYLDVGQKSRVDKTCIMHHGQTLKSLGVGTGHSCAQECYSPQELTSILTACPKLKDLALNLPKADLGKIDLMGIGFRLSPQNPGVDVRPEFEATLVSDSSFPSEQHTDITFRMHSPLILRFISCECYPFLQLITDQAPPPPL
jgi:hypothetical protein